VISLWHAGIATDAADKTGASIHLTDQYAVVSGGTAMRDASHVRIRTDAVQIVAFNFSAKSSEVRILTMLICS
jgi:hypothetical protein